MQLHAQTLQPPLHTSLCSLRLTLPPLRRSRGCPLCCQVAAAGRSAQGFGKAKPKGKSADRKCGDGSMDHAGAMTSTGGRSPCGPHCRCVHTVLQHRCRLVLMKFNIPQASACREAWTFEQLMLAWDDTFQATSEVCASVPLPLALRCCRIDCSPCQHQMQGLRHVAPLRDDILCWTPGA